MTRFAKFLHRLFDKIFGEWDEGPEPPARLREMALLFAEMHPRATRREWVDFAARHAGEAYRTGWVRGFEATVREEEKPWAGDMPEHQADALMPGWRDRLLRPDGVVEDLKGAASDRG
jgi:hypothetical protein